MMSAKRLSACFTVPLLVVVGLGAAGPVGLTDAVKNADRPALRALLQKRVDVNVPEADGMTALHWAAQRDDLETANLLIRAGANANVKTRLGVTPLLIASLNGNAALIEA